MPREIKHNISHSYKYTLKSEGYGFLLSKIYYILKYEWQNTTNESVL